MSAQRASGRRAAAIAAAAQLGPMSDAVAEAIQEHRDGYATKRAQRPEPLVDRRTASVDRRQVDRRGAVTVRDADGRVVIRPNPELKRFDEHPADVSAFAPFSS